MADGAISIFNLLRQLLRLMYELSLLQRCWNAMVSIYVVFVLIAEEIVIWITPADSSKTRRLHNLDRSSTAVDIHEPYIQAGVSLQILELDTVTVCQGVRKGDGLPCTQPKVVVETGMCAWYCTAHRKDCPRLLTKSE